jgi:DNA replication protein DnaC
MTDQINDITSGGVIMCEHNYPFGKGCQICEAVVAGEAQKEKYRLFEINSKMSQNVIQANIDKRLKSSMITPKFLNARFANYMADLPMQKIAVDKCRDFVDGFEIDKYDLVMLGGSGTGKDHLAAAIAHELISAGKTILIIDAEKIQRRIRDTYKSNEITEQSIMDWIISVDYLVINELGIRTSDAQAILINEICNDRVANEKRTVYIGNMNLPQFEKLVGDRAYDRIVRKDKSNVIAFDWPSYRQ